MAWECPACSEINNEEDLIKCTCGYELEGDPKLYKPKKRICPECKESNKIEQQFCIRCGLNLKLYAEGRLS